MKNRFCIRCQTEKPLDQFYRDKTNVGGRDYTCASCRRATQRERDNKPERILKSKEWFQSERGKELSAKRRIEDYNNNKPKHLAHRALRRLIKLGVIIRQPCEICGDEPSKGHHPDYSQPFAVVWLCQKHHSEHHRK